MVSKHNSCMFVSKQKIQFVSIQETSEKHHGHLHKKLFSHEEFSLEFTFKEFCV